MQYLVCEFDDTLLELLTQNHLDLDIYYSALKAEHVKACHERGIVVNVWTVNTLEEGLRMAEFGVDYITTNILE